MSDPELLDHLLRDRTALIRRQSEADRVIAASGAGHLVHEMNMRPGEAGRRPWRIDPVPLVLDGAVFDRLADVVSARLRAFEAILADLYGPRTLVRDGVVPGEALSSTSRYRMGTVGTPAPGRWLTTYAVDVVELADGSWRIVQDFTDAPTGVGYALLDRSAMLRVADEILGSDGTGDVAPVGAYAAELRHGLITNTAVSSPRIVLFSGGVDHPGYVEHSSLARLLGFTLVERPDLVVRQDRLWLRTLGGLDPIDVVYRRIEDVDTDPIEISGAGGIGVPGLLVAVANGGLVLANAHGTGVLEAECLTSFWSDAAEALTDRTLSAGVIADVNSLAPLAEVPVFRRGELVDAPVVVRLHAVAGPNGVVVMPGGNGRVLAPGDDPRHPSAHLAKDVWVVGPRRAVPVIVAPSLPQVDLASSVPTRAADALFWACRAAERAESIARTVRSIAARRRQDPTLLTSDGGRWTSRMAAALRSVRRAPIDETDEHRGPISELDFELAAATQELVSTLRRFVGEAATVGEFLPSNTARIMNQLLELTHTFGEGAAPIDVMDDVLASLSAFSGMWNESTVRGPAWRFGDIGIRIERSLVLLGSVAACVDVDRHDHEPDHHHDQDQDIVGAAALEALLAANESLIAYRRTYRSDVELSPTLALLLHDRDNPRAFAACVERIAEHVADIEWDDGSTMVADLGDAVANLRDTVVTPHMVIDHLDAARADIGSFADTLVRRWFATPVKPMLVRADRP